MLYARFLLNFCLLPTQKTKKLCVQLQKTKTKKKQRRQKRMREEWKDEAKENDQN